MKLLIAIVTYSRYLGIFPLVWERLKELEIPQALEVDYLVVVEEEHSKDKKFLGYVEKESINLKKIVVDWSDFKGFDTKHVSKASLFTEETSYRVVAQRNAYLEEAKKGNYDWLLCVDGDILPPKDGFIKLYKENKDYIGGWAYNKKAEEPCFNPNKIRYGVPYKVKTIGGYFVLEKKKVFDIPYSLWTDRVNSGDEMKRLKDIGYAHIEKYLHPGVYCEHLKEDGMVYEPSRKEKSWMK